MAPQALPRADAWRFAVNNPTDPETAIVKGFGNFSH